MEIAPLYGAIFLSITKILMNKSFLIIASILGCTAVMLGAFGAHGLKELINENQLRIYEKGVSYQFYHTLALFITAMLLERNSSKYFKWAGYCFVIGVLLFSGSLYILATADISGINKTIIGPITPLGGLGFILGWLFFMIGSMNVNTTKK